MTRHIGEWDEDGPEWGLVLDTTSVLISIHDKDYRIVKANAALRRLLRKGPTEIIGRKCYEVIHGTRQPPAHCPHSRALQTGSFQKEEFFEPRLGMTVVLSCHPLFGADGQMTGSIHLARDAKTPIPSNADPTKDLSDRQKRIFRLLCSGQTTKTIAVQLSVSPRTIEYHKRRMMKMFSASSVAELIARVLTKNPALVE